MDEKLRILVIDDEDSLRISLASILELEGYEVSMAASGFEAVDIAKQKKFDILFSDIRMPGMTGTEAFKTIRTIQPDVVGVMMTAYALNDLIVEALNYGAYACLSKPFEIETVLRTIKDITSRPFAVVIDNQESLNLKFLTALKKCGMNVAASSVDIQKVEYMFSHKPDILILDTDSDVNTSIEILKKLKELTGNIPKTILIGKEENLSVLSEIQKIGAATFVKKPIEIPKIFEIFGKEKRKFNVAMVRTDSEDFIELHESLKQNDFNLLSYPSTQNFFDEIKNSFFDVVLMNTNIQSDITSFHAKLQQTMPGMGVIFVLPEDINIETMKKKGCFYMHKPFEIENVVNLLNTIKGQ